MYNFVCCLLYADHISCTTVSKEVPTSMQYRRQVSCQSSVFFVWTRPTWHLVRIDDIRSVWNSVGLSPTQCWLIKGGNWHCNRAVRGVCPWRLNYSLKSDWACDCPFRTQIYKDGEIIASHCLALIQFYHRIERNRVILDFRHLSIEIVLPVDCWIHCSKCLNVHTCSHSNQKCKSSSGRQCHLI